MKEIEDNTNMERYTLFLGWKNQYLLKMAIVSKETYRFSIIPIKLPMAVFTGLGQKKFFFNLYRNRKYLK